MFRGIYNISLDSKGRLAVPTCYRDHFREHSDGKLIVTVDQVGCLLIYATPAWEAVEAQIAALPSFIARTRDIQRMVLGHASECELDGHGRILVPAMLRQFAEIDKRVVLAGQSNKFELWDEDKWMRRCEEWRAMANQDQPMPGGLEKLSI